MYKYKNIAFRTIERRDLETLRSLHNDQSTYLNLLNIDFIDENGQVQWWEMLSENKNDKRYVIAFKNKPDEIIGRLRIQNINFHHNNCEIGLDIITKLRGKGFGQKSYEMVLEFLFLHYNMNMVYLKVAEFNSKSKNLYLKIGFKETGYLPSFYFRYGKYWSYIFLSMTRDEYFNKYGSHSMKNEQLE